MASHGDTTLPATRRSRKSIAGRSPGKKLADKENATVDVGSTLAANRKKSRSKSMGPGGLDALKPSAGNRRVSLAAPSRPIPKSILKPTISSLPEIPPHKPKLAAKNVETTSSSGSATRIAVRTEEEQQAAAREREERERLEMEKELSDRREARRKSLANRRVSFAAEATLHTFHEIEYMQDSTTSTDSTRRASSLVAQSPAPQLQNCPGSEVSEPPSTPPEQTEEASAESPANQRDPHQKKSRRSSAIPPLNFNNPEDETLNSSVYSSDSEHADDVAEIQEEDSNSDSDVEDGTVMTVDADEMTSASVASVRSATSDSSSLDQNLRLAAQRAATQQLDEDEEEIPAFGGWGKKSNTARKQSSSTQIDSPNDAGDKPSQIAEEATETDMDLDMDITSAVGGIIKPHQISPQRDQVDDVSMDVTRVHGGILTQHKISSRRQSIKPSQQVSYEDESSLGEGTMDLTVAVGGIQAGRTSGGSHVDPDGNEEMSMEFTMAIGGVMADGGPRKALSSGRRQTMTLHNHDSIDDATMDMTIAVGRIVTAADQNDNNPTVEMDKTKDSRSAAKKLMEEEVDQPGIHITAAAVQESPGKAPISAAADVATTPGFAPFRGKGLRRTPARTPSGTPKSEKTTPAPGPRLTTPSRNPPPTMIGSRSATPKRTVSPCRSTTPKSASKSKPKEKSVFHQDPATGFATPRVVLTPQRRRLSGIGVDRSGLGSPRIAKIFDRRDSISNTAEEFVPGQKKDASKAVKFLDPRTMEGEIDRERQEENDRENARKILEREADGSRNDQDVTLNLREMIQGLSPKKNLLKGRKSLHIGSAKGVLGKRPQELDDDDDDTDEQDGVKRLRGLQGSPVKNVKLRSPPSKAETTGRITRATRKSLEEAHGNTITPTTVSSLQAATTPKSQGRFKNVDDDQPPSLVNFDEHDVVKDGEMVDVDDDRIHLQDFLNMTSIRFMELTTTKRRHTVAPGAPKDDSSEEGADGLSLERCVVAGACTVPMLELYQHSCRELKKYISEGRRIVREIETDTWDDNPPLFREYLSASPDFRILMDNQFKNVKTHARHLSKAMWYEWRMKLQEGLKQGLEKIAEGLEKDDAVLRQQEELLSAVLPIMLKRFEALEKEQSDLETIARELAESDPVELEDARSRLVSLDEDISGKASKLEEIRRQLEDSESSIKELTTQKHTCVEEIKMSEAIREECRGWSSSEIMALKDQVDVLEREHGWAITGIAGSTVSMTYLREIELVFDVSSFQPGQPNGRIDLWYIARSREHKPLPATPEQEFFLQSTRDQIRGLPQASTKLSRMLGMVSAAWDKAACLANHVRLLNVTFPVAVSKTSDTSVAIRSSLLMAPLASKVDVVLNLHSQIGGADVEVAIVPQVSLVYGEQFKVGKMAEFLATRIGGRVLGPQEQEGKESWSDVVVELHGRLLARGKKASGA